MIFAIIIAVGLALLAWFVPRAFVGVGLVLVVLSTVLRLALPDVTVGYLDEIVVVVGLVALTTRRALSRRLPLVPGWSLWFAGFFVIGLLSSLLGSVPTSIAFEGGFLAVKAALFGIAAAQIDWKVEDLRPFITGAAVMILVIFVTAVANFIAPVSWTEFILGRDIYIETLGPIPALIGPFEHPAALGRICAMLAIGVFTYRTFVRKTWFSAVLLGMATITGLATLRVKTIVSLIVSVVVLGVVNLKRFSRTVIIVAIIVAALAAVPVILYVAADVDKYLLTTSARTLMTNGSFDVAARHLPFGAGFGRFGSYTATVNYSPEYVRLGFPSYFGLEPAPGGQFLTDTAWPAIIGETGWLGTLLFAGGLVHIAVDFLRRTPNSTEPMFDWVRWTGFGWLVILVVESIGAPVFTSAPAYPLPFLAAGVFYALRRRAREPLA